MGIKIIKKDISWLTDKVADFDIFRGFPAACRPLTSDRSQRPARLPTYPLRPERVQYAAEAAEASRHPARRWASKPTHKTAV